METLICILGLAAVVSGLMVISSKNPVHTVFYLVLAFASTSVLLLIMGVEFLSLLFLIVYVGAIAILFLFVVMMLNIKLVEITDNTTRYVPIGFTIGFIFLGGVMSPAVGFGAQLSTRANFPLVTNPEAVHHFAGGEQLFMASNLEALGHIIYTNYFLYFI
jgi:NADH-quinone oxidoreductase subunit J